MNEQEKKALDAALDHCECPPLSLTVLKERMREELQRVTISADFVVASDHDFYCRCEKCKDWWRQVGPEEDGTFGPFTREEIMNNV